MSVVKPNFSDHLIYYKHFVKNWSKIIKMAFRHGLITSTKNMFRYPWMLEFLKINGLLGKLLDGRTGSHRKAVAETLDIVLEQSTGLMDGLLHDSSDKLVMHQAMVSPEIYLAMGLNPWPFDLLSLLLPTINPHAVEQYIDATENAGITPDVCSFSCTPIGIALKKHIPIKNAPFVSSDVACDSQMLGFQLIGREIESPAFQMDVPYHFKTEESAKYYAKQLMDMIAFLEENTSGKMDWDKFKHILDNRNKMNELALETWDMLRNKPAPLAAESVYLSHLWTFAITPGLDSSLRFWERLAQICRKNLEDGVAAVPNEKYRAVLWNTWTFHSPDLFSWAEKRYGITLLMDMMTYNNIPYVDTSSRQSMLEGMAHIHMSGPMARHTRGPMENYIDDLFHIYETLDLDMIWFTDHIGCKNATATLGVIREKCKAKGIPLMVLDLDILDPRLQDGDGIKGQVDRFMENIMKAERLDV